MTRAHGAPAVALAAWTAATCWLVLVSWSRLMEDSAGLPTLLLATITVVAVDSTEPDLDHGQIGRGRYRWIEEQFEGDARLRVFVCHHHLLPVPGTGRERNVIYDAGDAIECLQRAGVHLVLSGHKHVPYAWRLENLFVVNAGPSFPSEFHIVGTIFDRVYPGGNPAQIIESVQTWTVPAGGGAVFETVFEKGASGEGMYAFVTHAFAYTGKGAVGLIQVDPKAPAAPDSYPTLGDPFTAGVQPFSPPSSVASLIATSGPSGS